jgi:hypothetical protein
MIQRSLAALGWVGLALIVYVTLCPIGSRPEVAGVHWDHFGAFALLGFAFAVAYPRRLGFVVLIVIGSAAILELMQLITVDRHARLIDALVKEGGGICGIIVGRLLYAIGRSQLVAAKPW